MAGILDGILDEFTHEEVNRAILELREKLISQADIRDRVLRNREANLEAARAEYCQSCMCNTWRRPGCNCACHLPADYLPVVPEPSETLRDRFAMAALAGFRVVGVDPLKMAIQCWEVADAMMKARDKK